MRITFVLPCYPWRPIGAFRVVYEYANQLASRGHHVTAVHARRTAYEKDFWAPRGFYRQLRRKAGNIRDAIFTPGVPWGSIDQRVRMLFVPEPTAAFVPDADAVIAGAWGTAPHVLWYPKEKGEKFHLIQHYAVTFGLPKPWVDTIWRAPLHNLVVSKWLGEVATELGIEDVAVVPNGINGTLFRCLRPPEERAEKIAMLFSPRDWKGPADGIEAIQAAKLSHPDLQCVLFGTSPRPADVPEWVEYRRDPPQEELVRDIYNSSSIFICPSWLEGFALPPLEAMACGCAVVTTDCGGNRDYAEHDANCLISPPRRPDQLAENLCRVLDDDLLRRRLTRAGVERAREFTWERSTDKLDSLLKERFSSLNGTTPPAMAVPSR